MAGYGIAVELKAVKTVHDTLKRLKEDQRQFVLRTACDKLKMIVSFGGAPPSAGARVASSVGQVLMPSSESSAPSPAGGSNPKQFLADKSPSQDIERIACLAYLLTHIRDIGQFKAKELIQMNTDAAGRRLSNASFAARNAVIAGYLAPALKGRKQITALGEKIVEALPDREKVNAILASAGSRGRRRPGRKKSARG